MKFNVTFSETSKSFDVKFEAFQKTDPPVILEKTVTENGTYEAGDDGADGFNPVIVDVPIPDGYVNPKGVLEITENGTYDVTEKASATVNVPGVINYDFSAAALEGSISTPSLDPNATKIRDGAFYGYTNLVLDSLPSGVTSIGNKSFYGCMGLSLTNLPDGVAAIGSSAFAYCSNLSLTGLPDGVASIGYQAFYLCFGIALTKLPDSIATIGGYAFSNCNVSFNIMPGGLAKIDAYAFESCVGLTSIIFEGKPETISSSAFSGCTNLTTINVPWAEGEVANAPWGATNATINYNCNMAEEM